MNRLACDDSRHRAQRCMHEHSLPKENLHVPAADRVHSEKPKAVDVADNQANLITMGIQQNGTRSLSIHCGQNIPMNVCGHIIRKRRCKIADDTLNLLLSSGGSGRQQKILQKLVRHGRFRNACESIRGEMQL